MKRTTRVITLSVTLAVLAACGNGAKIGSGDLADAATTFEVLRNPAYKELNPTIPSDPALGVAVLLAEKYLAKAALIEMGVEPELANKSIDTFGWFWACHNLAFFAGSGHPLGAAIGVACSAYYWDTKTAAYEARPQGVGFSNY